MFIRIDEWGIIMICYLSPIGHWGGHKKEDVPPDFVNAPPKLKLVF